MRGVVGGPWVTMLVTISVEHKSRRAAVGAGTPGCRAQTWTQELTRASSDRSFSQSRVRAAPSQDTLTDLRPRLQALAGTSDVGVDGNQCVDAGSLSTSSTRVAGPPGPCALPAGRAPWRMSTASAYRSRRETTPGTGRRRSAPAASPSGLAMRRSICSVPACPCGQTVQSSGRRLSAVPLSAPLGRTPPMSGLVEAPCWVKRL